MHHNVRTSTLHPKRNIFYIAVLLCGLLASLFSTSSPFSQIAPALASPPCLALAAATVGNASVLPLNEYQLTPNLNTQAGAIWGNTKIDLTKSFFYEFEAYLGNDPSGADGMVFMLQNDGAGLAAIGATGDGIGAAGITPSFGVEFDTYSNAGTKSDPVFDHTAIFRAGDNNHATGNAITAPVQLGTGNVKDNTYHTVRFTWNPATKLFTYYFDGAQIAAITRDIVTLDFAGNPSVYFGFTASTGGSKNSHRVCNKAQANTTPLADLGVTKTDGVTTYSAGGSNTYTVTVSNAGPDDVTGVNVTDNLPSQIASATWTCVGTGTATCPASGSGSINTSAVNIPASQKVTFTVNATIGNNPSGNLVNTASVTGPNGTTDPLNANDSATDTDTFLQTASQLVVAGYPSPTIAGAPHNFTVTAEDTLGNTVTGYTGTVHFTSTDGAATLPGDATLINGVGTFSATFKTAGTQSITGTDTVSAISGSQTGIVVNPGAAATFTVNGYPSPTTAGASHTFTVTALDQFGNTATGYSGTVHFTSSDGAATLPANVTLTNGTGTFSATLKTAGTQSLTATDTVTNTITGSQTGIVVNGGAAATLTVSGYTTPTTAGTAHNFTVTALDQFGNVATGYSGTVHFTSSDAQATLPIDATLTNGVGTFSATLKTAGTQSLTATDTVTSTITGSQTGIVVTAAAAATLTVSGYLSPTVAGVSHPFTVTAKDAFGNTATTYAGTVHFTSSDGAATLPADATLTNGTGTFSATFNTNGTQSISATDTVTSSITGSQTGIVVGAATASQLVVAGYLSPTVAGVSHTFTVTAKDTLGNIVTTYNGTVHFTSSDGAAILPANATLTNGTGTFSATLKTAGTQSLTATDTVTSSITGSQTGIVVTAAAVSQLVVAGYPSPTVAGVSHTFTVTAKDAFGNIVTGYAGTVHFTSSDGAATLPANSTLTNGTGTFSAILQTAGTQSITATDTVTSSITGSQTGIVVGASITFLVTGYPSPVYSGSSNSFTVTAKDNLNNTVTTYAGTVHFTSSDGAAALPANATLTNGVGTFNATLVTVGTQSITATDTVTSSITGSQTGIVVNAALPKETVGVYRPSTHQFTLHTTNTFAGANLFATFGSFTNATPVAGDWNGDGIDTIGLYDETTGRFYLRDSNTSGFADYAFSMGNPGDLPLGGKWSALATHDGVGTFRPANGLIYLRNNLSTGFADYTMIFGIPGDKVMADDWNGDGIDSPGIYRQSQGRFYLSNTVTTGFPVPVIPAAYQGFYGVPGDNAVSGDWGGIGRAGIGVFRPSNLMVYLKTNLTTGFGDLAFAFGATGDMPIAGRWTLAGGAPPPSLIVAPSAPTKPAPTAAPTAPPSNPGVPSFDG